jgi:methylmalonyl-CoA mutase cobalamin-binding domain/chain
MMPAGLLERLKRSLLDLKIDAAVEATDAIIGDGTITIQEAVGAVAEALQTVGKRFQEGEWFLGELVYAAEITKQTMDLLRPLMPAGASRQLGTIVVGTVAGDLHDLGKNIFATYARSVGFEVMDLGVDVPKQTFAAAVTEHEPVALGMSCLLTTTSSQIGEVLEELKGRGIRDAVKIVVGGAALTEQFAREVGVDAFAADVVTGTEIIRRWSRP